MWNSRLSRTSPWRAVLGAVKLAAACFLGLLIAGSAGAHRGHGVWIELVWASDRFEITHHLHLQDAQSVLERVDPGSDLGSPRSLAQLALYVEQHFAVHTDGGVILLETLGAEIEGDFLYVYQEWQTTEPVLPEFRSQLLTDVLPDAVTWVQIQAPGINTRFQVPAQDSTSP